MRENSLHKTRYELFDILERNVGPALRGGGPGQLRDLHGEVSQLEAAALLADGVEGVPVELGGGEGVGGQEGGHQRHLLLGEAPASGGVGEAGEGGHRQLGESPGELVREDELSAGEEEAAHLGPVPGEEPEEHHLDGASGEGPLLVLARHLPPARQAPHEPQAVAAARPGVGEAAQVSGLRPLPGQELAHVLRVLPGQVHGGDGGHALLVAPQHLLLEGEVGGQLDLLLDGSWLHADPDAGVVPAELAVDPSLALHITLATCATDQGGDVSVDHPSSEESLNSTVSEGEMSFYSFSSLCKPFQLEIKLFN